jgi:hypothetical protein
MKLPMNCETYVRGQGWIPDRVKMAEEASRCAASGTVTDGVFRWNSNGNVPPQDILNLLQAEEAIDFDMEATQAAREADTTAFLAEYREAQKNHTPSAEEMFEMRAAFGPGTTVVNVITGRKTRL